jgi:hypothetical protein
MLNGVGAAATALVSIVQVVTKFTTGAWIVVLIIPAIILMLKKIHSHYEEFAREVRYTGHAPLFFLHHTVVVPVNGITKPVAGALVYATTISEDVRAAYVDVDPDTTRALQAEWNEWDIGVDLQILPSPFRSVIRPLVDYVRELNETQQSDLVTVIVPEIVPHKWWEHLLHNKTALYIKTAFLFKPNVVVTAVPYRLGHSARLRDLIRYEDVVDADAAAAVGS